MPTTLRNVRITDELWKETQQAAAVRGETVTAIIIRALKEYCHKT